LTLWLSG